METFDNETIEKWADIFFNQIDIYCSNNKLNLTVGITTDLSNTFSNAPDELQLDKVRLLVKLPNIGIARHLSKKLVSDSTFKKGKSVNIFEHGELRTDPKLPAFIFLYDD